MKSYENFIDEGFRLLSLSTEEERKKYLDLAKISKATCPLATGEIYPQESQEISEEVKNARLESNIE